MNTPAPLGQGAPDLQVAVLKEKLYQGVQVQCYV
jgi:hypothetical protein